MRLPLTILAIVVPVAAFANPPTPAPGPGDEVVALPLSPAELKSLKALSAACGKDAGCFLKLIDPDSQDVSKNPTHATFAAYHDALSQLDPATDRKILGGLCASAGSSTFRGFQCGARSLAQLASAAGDLAGALKGGMKAADALAELEKRHHPFAGILSARCPNAPDSQDACFAGVVNDLQSRYSRAAAKMRDAAGSFDHWSYLVHHCDLAAGKGACSQARDWSEKLREPADSIPFTPSAGAAVPVPGEAGPDLKDSKENAGGGGNPGAGGSGGAGTGTGGGGSGNSGWTFNPINPCYHGAGGTSASDLIGGFGQPGYRLPIGPVGPVRPGPLADPHPTQAQRDPTGMAAILDARDRELGLSRGGDAVSALHDAMSEPGAPYLGHATFTITTDASGHATGVEMSGTDGQAAWADFGPILKKALEARSFRVPSNANGVRVTVSVVAEETLPSGSKPGHAVTQEGAGVRFDPTEIGAHPSRRVSVRITDDGTL
jgi:hypothetical protein